MKIKSEFQLVARDVPLPQPTGLRVLHMPIVLGDDASVPDDMAMFNPLLRLAAERFDQYVGQVVYLTVDERSLQPGQTLRRPGLHVDGWWKTEDDSAGGSWGGGGGWGGKSRGHTAGTGLLTVSTPAGCRAFAGTFDGEPAPEGDCEHLRPQAVGGMLLDPGCLYWLSPLCVHESLPVEQPVRRQFVRVSLPSTADWYDGCTPNPKGIRPTGTIKPRRRFNGS